MTFANTHSLIKVWNKETLQLQASLHGHEDMIIDIQVSKCNRYFVSGSSDGTLIFWDLQECRILAKRTQDHTAQVNSVQFVMAQCSPTATARHFAALDSSSQFLPMQ